MKKKQQQKIKLEFLTPETIRRMGTSFRRNDLWDRLGWQALLVIG